MSRGINSKEIPSIVLRGMKTAAKNWDRLHGSWADKAPEYWFTVLVALQLQKVLDEDKNWICFEGNVRKVLDTSGPKRRGRPHAALRRNGRCDIVIERANEKPFAAIEIKRNAYAFYRSLGKDVERLRHVMAQKSSFSIACLALYSSASDEGTKNGARKTLRSRFDRNLERSRELCSGSKLHVRSCDYITNAEDSEDCWGVQCVYLSRS